MYPIVTAKAWIEEDGRDEILRRYARWEYGAGSADWLLATARGLPVAARPTPREAGRTRSLVARLRTLFRPKPDLAALDVRGADRTDS